MQIIRGRAFPLWWKGQIGCEKNKKAYSSSKGVLLKKNLFQYDFTDSEMKCYC
jgi:hypothetical protein